MPAHLPLFHAVRERLTTTIEAKVVPPSSIERLALFVTGIIAAQSCVLAQVADELDTLELTAATQPDSVARRLRRTVCDSHLEASCCYEPVLPTVIDWEQLRETPRGMVVLIVDESSKADQVHVLRTALAYRGSSLPLAWEVWEQNQAQEPGSYWQHMDAMLERVAALLPPDLEVLVLADRAFDIPPFIDRITARGWHWMVRCKAKGTMRYLDQQGQEWALADLVRRQLAQHARRWKARGRVFQDAGWREASVVAYQGRTHDDPLVVLTDLDPAWEVLDDYRRRFWIEPGFRNDKSRGWKWEQCQVRGVHKHQRVLLALAWATLLVLGVGVECAQQRLQARGQRAVMSGSGRVAKPQPARESLFTMGMRQTKRWVRRASACCITWLLPDVDARSWNAQWYHDQAQRYIFTPVRS